MKFFVSTGEASGDLHLSYLVKSVKARYKDVDFVGVAGEKSQKEGVEILQDINELAIMGFTEVLKKYKFLKQKAYEYLQYIKDNQIKNVILVDYKTDFVNDENKEEVINRYKKQLDLYAEVVENLTGKEVKEKCIYLFSIDEEVSI